MWKTRATTGLFVKRMITLRWPLLALACVSAFLAWRPAAQVRFDRSIENMFRPGDPLLVSYQRLKDEFGEGGLVMAVYREPQLLSKSGDGLRRLEGIERQLRDVPGVREVLSTLEALPRKAPPVILILPTFHDARTRESSTNLEALRQAFGDAVLDPIHQAVRLRECPAYAQTIFEHDPKSRAAEEYSRVVWAVIDGSS